LKTGYDAFIPHFKPDVFILKYIGVIVFVVNYTWWKIFKRTEIIDSSSVDLISDRREFLERESPQDAEWKRPWWKKFF
jgi:amino acid permease